jgi:hypothetical protein
MGQTMMYIERDTCVVRLTSKVKVLAISQSLSKKNSSLVLSMLLRKYLPVQEAKANVKASFCALAFWVGASRDEPPCQQEWSH